jgi:signal transduction histidine kinase
VRWGLLLNRLDHIERREEHLWFVALLLVFFLAVALFVLDYVAPHGERPKSLNQVLDNQVTRSALLVIVLLICGYFQERIWSLRRDNRDLVEHLESSRAALEKKNRQLVRWGELSHALIANSELQRLLELIVATALEVTTAERSSVLLLDDNHENLRVAAAAGPNSEEMTGRVVRVGESIAGWVATECEPLLLDSTTPDPRVAGWMHRRQEIPWAISVPLRVQQRVVGTLNVSRVEDKKAFGQEDVRALSLFADQAALAIERAQLYRESQAQLERLLNMLEELERTQAQLVQSEKLASIGLLAGGVAHEINNPLTVILGRTEMMLMGDGLPEDVRTDVETIRGETSRIAEIVRNLLAFSRDSATTAYEPLDVAEVVRRSLALVEHQMTLDNIKVIRDLTPDLPQVRANLGQLEQVMTNLFINAVHAMSDGGTLTVRTLAAGPNEVGIEVADTGCGIAEEALGKVFEPFFTTKDEGKGTGLGLAVAYGIIQRHGGHIGVDSREGEGTRFTVVLPALDPSTLRGQAEPALERVST